MAIAKSIRKRRLVLTRPKGVPKVRRLVGTLHNLSYNLVVSITEDRWNTVRPVLLVDPLASAKVGGRCLIPAETRAGGPVSPGHLLS